MKLFYFILFLLIQTMSELLLFEEEDAQFNTKNTIWSNKNYYELENELIESKKYISLLLKEQQKELDVELEEAKIDANLIRTHHNLIENIKYYQKLFKSKYNNSQNGCPLFGNSHNYRNPNLKYSISLSPISKKYGLTFQYIAPCQTQGDVIDYVRHRKNSAASSNSGIVQHQALDNIWEYFLFPHNVTDTEIEYEIKILSYVLDEYVKAFSVIDIKERLEKLCGENMDLMKLNISYGDWTKSLFD